MAAETNQAPTCKWFAHVMASGIKRRRLWVNGTETPFFVDTAPNAAHRTYGQRHGLFGAGMSEPHWVTGTRSAAVLACGKNLALLQHRAEQLALA